jgi:hypothetical protein
MAGIVLAAVFAALASCGKNGDRVATAQDAIFKALTSQDIYERDNLPEADPPTPEQIKGWFDMVRGTYRHIVNEDRPDRGPAAEYGIERGDSIAFMFDARVFAGSNFESCRTFYTNIDSRINELFSDNPDFAGWSTEPLRIKVGDDPGILKSLQEALISCRAGDGTPGNDGEPGAVSSDEVRVYITSDLAFGNRTVYDVPSGSTIVYEVTEIEIIR